MAKALPSSLTLLKHRLGQIEKFISFVDTLASHLKGEHEYHQELLNAHREGREVDPCKRTRINLPDVRRLVEFGSQARDLTQHFDEREWNCVCMKLERALELEEALVRAAQQIQSSEAFDTIAREFEELSGQKQMSIHQRNAASWMVVQMYQTDALDECRLIFSETVDYLRSQKARIEGQIEAHEAGAQSGGSLEAGDSEIEDASAFVPISTLYRERFGSLNSCKRFLERTPSIRTMKPAKNRFSVHAGDWHNHWADEERKSFETLDKIESAKADERQKKAHQVKRK